MLISLGTIIVNTVCEQRVQRMLDELIKRHYVALTVITVAKYAYRISMIQ